MLLDLLHVAIDEAGVVGRRHLGGEPLPGEVEGERRCVLAQLALGGLEPHVDLAPGLRQQPVAFGDGGGGDPGFFGGDLLRAAGAQRVDLAGRSPRSIGRCKALPGEIDALKARGAQEIVAEEERIASAAAADRARLLTQTRREIEVRLQAAQRELSDHAATLALDLAKQRLAREMTPADHTRLVDRYVHR